MHDFLDAAKKGQGRAIAALREGTIAPDYNLIRRLVLRWPGYDMQIEGTRGWYTVEIMEATGFRERLSALLLALLKRRMGPSRNRSHRDAVVGELAKRGDPFARQAMYDAFDPERGYRFAEEIIAVDGLDGLGWLIANSAKHLDTEKVWEVNHWIYKAKEAVGEAAVEAWLAVESAANPDIRSYLGIIGASRRRSPKPDISKLTYEDLRGQVLGGKLSRISVRFWARDACEQEVKRAWADLLIDTDTEWLRRLGAGLSMRSELAPVDQVIAKAKAWSEYRNPYAWSLERLSDPRVRSLALDFMASGHPLDGLDLLERNAFPGDEEAVMAAASYIHDENDLHRVGLSLLGMPTYLDRLEMLLWVYENTPCSFCRGSAVRDMVAYRTLPVAVARECVLDCDADTRAMAVGPLFGLH